MMTIEDQIILLEEELLSAMKAGDITVLEQLIHDDLVFNIPNGLTISKSMDIETYSSGVMKIFDIAIIERTVKSLDDFSTVAVTINLTAKYGDQVIDGKYKYLRVWKLFGKSWKIIAGSGFRIQ